MRREAKYIGVKNLRTIHSDYCLRHSDEGSCTRKEAGVCRPGELLEEKRTVGLSVCGVVEIMGARGTRSHLMDASLHSRTDWKISLLSPLTGLTDRPTVSHSDQPFDQSLVLSTQYQCMRRALVDALSLR